MTDAQLLTDVDPFISQRVVEIRDRFGMRGLRAAESLIEMEIAIFDDPVAEADDRGDVDTTGGG